MSNLLKLILLLTLTGCATSRQVTVTSTSRPYQPANYSFRIVTAQTHDPIYPDFADQLETALSGFGLYPADGDVSPGLIVQVKFGVERETVLIPIIRSVEIPSEWGEPPKTVIVQGVRPQEKYIKSLTLVGRSPDTDSAPVWIVYAEISDNRDDLIKSLPILLSAAMKKIGVKTDGEEKLKIRPSDSDLAFILYEKQAFLSAEIHNP